jgi:beta-lactamase regulating signal transducer with metallopeptidase domain
MNACLGTTLFDFSLNEANELLLNGGMKSLLLMAAVLMLIALWRKGAAATRHFLLLASVVSLLILPFASFLPPVWSGSSRAERVIHQWVGSMAGNTLPNLSLVATRSEMQKNPEAGKAKDPGSVSSGAFPGWRLDFRWCVLLVWAAGVLVMVMQFLLRSICLRKIERASQILGDADCLGLADTVRSELGLKRQVRVLVSDERLMPMTWGWRRPVVLLPADAMKWDAERLRIVLRHELAHAKRWDCLTQSVANLVRAFYWFNPLVWLAARQMCLERERACDDLVLSAGARPSEYAGHLLEIARQFACAPRAEAIAMARPSSLEQRLQVIVDASHRPGRLRPASALAILAIMSALALGIGGYKSIAAQAENSAEMADSLRQQQLARLQTFFAAKEKQSLALATKAGETNLLPEFHPYFDAAAKGDWQTVSNIYADFHRRHPQYQKDGEHRDPSLRVSYWQPLLETGLAYSEVASDEPRYVETFIDETVNSIPAGSIYFGGTDPGRGLITAFSKSHADADPFFTLTQNALADSSYLEYLRTMYGGKIYVPSEEDAQQCFQEYLTDAQRRLAHDTAFPKEPKQIKPGEDVRIEGNSVNVSGQVAVMSINGLLTKKIFDGNPDKEFYIEESFPLDWMYPYLEPHGLILRLNRQKVGALSSETIQRDHEYWTRQVQSMLGDWLTYDTSAEELAAFVEKVYVQHDLSGFTGDPRFVQDANACKMFSKLRSSIGGVYNWHIQNAGNSDDRTSMNKEAEFAFKQAFAMCPYSPEAVFRYVQLLMAQKRYGDALVIAEAAARMPSLQRENGQLMRGLVTQLKKLSKK